MSTTEEPTPEKSASHKHANPKRTAMIVIAIVVLAAFAWTVGSKYLAVAAAKREGVMHSAAAMSSAMAP
jgi:hypothetical protein